MNRTNDTTKLADSALRVAFGIGTGADREKIDKVGIKNKDEAYGFAIGLQRCPGCGENPMRRRRRNSGKRTSYLSVPDRHQLKIARDTLKMSDAGVKIMGGPTKSEAREIIERLTGRKPKENPRKRKYRIRRNFKKSAKRRSRVSRRRKSIRRRK